MRDGRCTRRIQQAPHTHSRQTMNFRDQNFSVAGYKYGTAPNAFLVQQAHRLPAAWTPVPASADAVVLTEVLAWEGEILRDEGPGHQGLAHVTHWLGQAQAGRDGA